MRARTRSFGVLVLCLLLAGALVPPAGAPALGLVHVRALPLAESEGEGEGEELEEGTGGEDEGEEAEGEEFEVSGDTVYLPPECLLRSAEATVVAQGSKVALTLRYSAESPAKIKVSYWLKGGRGSLQLGSTTHRIELQGALRVKRHLSEREAAKVRAAHAFIVDVDVPAASAECRRYPTLRLTTRHLRGERQSWSQ
jgi:hypothetical protein